MDSESVNLPACWSSTCDPKASTTMLPTVICWCAEEQKIVLPDLQVLSWDWTGDLMTSFSVHTLQTCPFQGLFSAIFVLLIGGFAVLKWPPGSILKLDSCFWVLEGYNEPYAKTGNTCVRLKAAQALSCSLVSHEFNSYESTIYILKVALKKKHTSNQVPYWSVGDNVVIRGSTGT